MSLETKENNKEKFKLKQEYNDSDKVIQFLSFYVDEELFAVNIERVKEIIEYHAATHVPMMSKIIQGVINLRGNVVPVVNLAHRFNKNPKAVSKRTSFIIIEVNSDEGIIFVGILVDSVNEVVSLPISAIENPPEFGTSIRTEFLQNIGKFEHKFMMILNCDVVLNVDELAKSNERKSGSFRQ